MATTASTNTNFANDFPTSPSGGRTSTRNSKRKRDSETGQPTSRGTPTPRRTANQTTPGNTAENPDNNTGGAATAFMGGSAGNGANGANEDGAGATGGPAPFDFSALAAGNTSQQNAAAALTQHYSMTVPPPPAANFINQPTQPGPAYPDPPTAANNAGGDDGGFDTPSKGLVGDDAHTPSSPTGTPSSGSKPQVGSSAWHAMRKSNHKEVERRRRETINEGINELAKIVPGCEKNKGAVLARAVQYIQKLQEDASANIDKWTFEKLVTDQAIADLSSKLGRAWEDRKFFRDKAGEAGLDVDALDTERDLEANEQAKNNPQGQEGENGQGKEDDMSGGDATGAGLGATDDRAEADEAVPGSGSEIKGV